MAARDLPEQRASAWDGRHVVARVGEPFTTELPMNPYSIRDALDRALTHVTMDHGAGPDTTKAVLVNVEPDGKAVVVGDADNTPIWNRRAILAGLAWQAAGAAVDPLLAPIPPAALAAFDVPTPVKKNRAQRRKEARDGR